MEQSAAVLDVNCATGEAMRKTGFQFLRGAVEEGAVNEKQAEGWHVDVVSLDSMWTPSSCLPFSDGAFQGAVCADLSYGTECVELCRVLAPGGFAVVGIQAERWNTDHAGLVSQAKELEAQGKWCNVLVSTPEAGDLSEEGMPIMVKYAVWRVPMQTTDPPPDLEACKQQ